MKKLIASLFASLALTGLIPGTAFAVTGNATMSFSPATGIITSGQDWTVKVNINTDGKDSTGADVVINFEKDKLELKSITFDKTNATFYPSDGPKTAIATANSTGHIEMARTITPADPSERVYTNGTGTFANLVFTPKVTSGTTALTFAHIENNTTDSNITPNNTDNGLDILKSVTNGTYTIQAGTPVPPVGSDPVINSIAPSSGSAANTVNVTINGTNFGTFTDGSSKVYVGTKLVTITNWTDTQIQIQVAAEPDLKADSIRQVKVHRADGKEATYTGYRLVGSGPAIFIWTGIISMAAFLAWFVYRRMNSQLVAASVSSYSIDPILPEHYHSFANNPETKITYRDEA